MLLQKNRLTEALRRGDKYRHRATLVAVITVIIAWTALFAPFLSMAEMNSGPYTSTSTVFFVFTVFLLVPVVTLAVTWFGARPIDTEINEAQSALEVAVDEEIAEIEKEREKIHKHITEADKARHEFLNTMSFELRSPLNSIIGFSSMLYQNMDEVKIKNRRQTYAFDINRSAMHVLNVINNILDVSNLGTGSSDLRIERISAFELMKSCHNLSEIRGTKTGLAFIYDFPDANIYFNGDPGRIKQILLNLYSNAVKFTDPPGAVYVTLRQTKKGDIQFIIKDEGIGIPVDDLDIVLRRFGKVDSQEYALRNEDGLGLGLTLVQQLTEMHEGTFNLESTEGVGTTVTITLPSNLMTNTDINTDIKTGQDT